MTAPATNLDHFEALYAASDDPWDVRGAWYEQRKRALLLACLRKPRYRSVFEPGCGNGEMSAALAPRCDRLLACDGSASAVAAARRRLRMDTGVAADSAADTAASFAVNSTEAALRIERRLLPAQWPDGERFDLIVLSELGYYFGAPDLARMLAQAQAGLAPDGELVMCHYLHDFDDRVTATRALHGMADALPGLVRTLSHRDADFLLEAWRPAGGGAA